MCRRVQKPDCFEVTADVPGFSKEQINVEVHDNILSISAEKSEEKTDDSEKDGVKYHRVERSSGSMHRQVKLPASANMDALTASSDNGVLRLVVPKRATAAAEGPRKIAIA